MEKIFEPVNVPKTSDYVADLLRKAILEERFKPGEFLPSERALSGQLKVTRNTVREALRQLEKERLISIKQGKGIKVENYLKTAGLEVAKALFSLKGKGQRKIFKDIATARTIIGYAMIEYSLNNLKKNRLKGIISAIDRFIEEADKPSPDPLALQELDFEIHNKIIEAGGNIALLLLHNSIRHTYSRTYKLFSSIVSNPIKSKKYYKQIKKKLEEGKIEKTKEIFKKYFKYGEKSLKTSLKGGEK